jgi:hypothetical protein
MKYLRIDWKPKRLDADFSDSTIMSVKKLKKPSAKYHSPDTHYKLFYSKADSKWTPKVSGKCAATLINHGDGFIVKFFDGKEISLDYSQAQYLKLLFQQEAQDAHGKEVVTEYEKK